MTDAGQAASPLETAAGTAGSDAIEALGLLGNETRLAILLALWEAYDPYADTNAVSFSQLRERIGVRDSGQFNYHLGKLEEYFVQKTDEGYSLRPAGLQLVQTIIASFSQNEPLSSVELDLACSLCGAPTAITYQEGWLYHVCTECEGGLGADKHYPEGTLFAEPFASAALANRTPEEVFAAGLFRLLQVMTMKLGGLCPRCSGVVESSLHVCEAHDPRPGEVCSTCGNASQVRIRWVCSVCKYEGGSSPSGAIIAHPEVIAFYHDHGIDIGYTLNDFERSKQVLTLLWNHEQELVSTDPPRVRVTVRYEGDELHLMLDEELNVIDVSKNGEKL